VSATAIALACLLSLGAAGAGPASDDDLHARMAALHAGDRPEASPAATAAPASAVEESEVSYATLDGKPVRGFLAQPAGKAAGAPGILVIHEWWGLNDNIRSMARRLAGEGYAALAVDLYAGRSASTPEEARATMQAAMANRAAVEDNLRQAYGYLEGTVKAPKVGTIGWCFGGGWSLATALLLPDKIDATVIYYGRLETDAEKLRPLAMPILGIFGSLDEGIPVASVRAFEAALKGLGKPAEIHVYEGADHAFANPSGTRYKEDAAKDAWEKTVAFLARHLKG
jgi:carboxymethylenebutenolidase